MAVCVCVCVCEAFLSEAHRTLISDSCFAQGECVSVCLWIRSVSVTHLLHGICAFVYDDLSEPVICYLSMEHLTMIFESFYI